MSFNIQRHIDTPVIFRCLRFRCTINLIHFICFYTYVIFMLYVLALYLQLRGCVHPFEPSLACTCFLPLLFVCTNPTVHTCVILCFCLCVCENVWNDCVLRHKNMNWNGKIKKKTVTKWQAMCTVMVIQSLCSQTFSSHLGRSEAP